MASTDTDRASYRNIPNWIVFSIPAVVGMLIYLPLLKFPLFYDDLLGNRIVEKMTFSSVWLPTPTYSYYRPFYLSLYLFFRNSFDGYPAMLMHGINIIQQGINIYLVSLLSWKLWKDSRWASISGMLFALYPFAYQDVVSFASMPHLLTLNIVLVGSILYIKITRSYGSTRILLIVIATVLNVIGLLTHESALIFGPLMALIHWNLDAPKLNWRSFVKPYLIFCLLDVTYLIAYPFINRQSDAFSAVSIDALSHKTLFAMQGVAYPFGSLYQLFGDKSGNALILIGVFILIGLTIWRIKEGVGVWPFILTWGWFFIGSLVLIIPLGLDYVLHSSRLLYIPSIGAVMLWPLLLQNKDRKTSIPAAIIVTYILVSSGLSLQSDLSHYETLMQPVTVMQEIPELADGDQIVFVNLPEWIVPKVPSFPIGVEFAALMGPHLYIEELVWLNTQNPSLQAAAIEIPDILSDASDYRFAVFAPNTTEKIQNTEAQTTHHVISTQIVEGVLTSRYTGTFQEGSIPAEYIAQMGPFLLEGIALQKEGTQSFVELTWAISGEIDPFQTVFLHILDNTGTIITQLDGPPLGVPLTSLGVRQGDVIIERRALDASFNGDSLRLGVYNYITGERLHVFLQDGSTSPDDMVIISFEDLQR